jgi:Xaa-Pro aminopeptidase
MVLPDIDQFAVDWEHRIDFDRLRKLRLERMNKVMKERDVDGLVVFRKENIRYVTSHRPLYWIAGYITRDAVIMKRGEDPYLYVASGDLGRVKQGMPWLSPENVKPCPNLEEAGIAKTEIMENWKPLMEKIGLSDGKVGVDACTFTCQKLLEEALPGAEFVDGDQLLKDARAVKNEEEIKCTRVSVMIAEQMIYAAWQIAEPGIRENDIAGAAAGAMYRLCGEWVHGGPVVATGWHTAPLYRMATDKIVRWGDFLFLDLGTSYNGYHSDLANTSVVGRPTEKQRELYDVAKNAQFACAKAFRPGNTTEDVNNAARGYLKEVGYYDYGYFGILGHGMGLSVQDYPIIGELVTPGEKKRKLEPGMVISVEPGVFVPGVGGVRIEDNYIITETGCEKISKMPYEIELARLKSLDVQWW